MPRLGSGIPLVARAAEMDRLRASLTRAEAGTAGAVLVSGDAGVGKSRLLEELERVAATRGALVLSGRCLDVGETGLPYLPFVEILMRLNRQDPGVVAEWPALIRLLPESSMPAAKPESSNMAPKPGTGALSAERDLGQLQLFDALTSLITDLGATRCVVLLVEDLHWADSSTRDLLSFLVSRLRTQRLLVVATYRADDLHRRHPLRPLLAELVRLPAVERIDLTAFDQDNARRFVMALADGPVSDRTVRQIAERSEGNAFFAEELLAAWADAGDGNDYAGMPTALADVLLARMERLSPAAQALIRLASVGGRRVRHSWLQAVSDLEPVALDEALREAVQHHVLLVDDQAEIYAFRHALLREAVYSDLLPGERVRLHAAYARFLATKRDQRGASAGLAHHSLQSHDLPTALAASVAAADEADRLGAPAEELRHLEQALKLWDAVDPAGRPDGVTEPFLLRQASFAAGTSGEPERAIAYARSAVDRFAAIEEPEDAARSYRRLAQALAELDGKEPEAGEAIAAAWRLVADRPPSYTRAWVQAVLAMSLRRGDPGESRAAARNAIADARVVGSAGPEADALVTLGMLDAAEGLVDAAIKHFTAAIRTAYDHEAPSTELRARYMLGLYAYDRGDLATAVRVFDESVERAKATGLTWSIYGVEVRIIRAIVKFVSGDWDGSAAAAEPPGRQVSDTLLARIVSTGIGVLIGRGRFDEAERLLADLREHWHRDVEIVIYSGYHGAELAMWQGHPERAVEVLAEVSAWVGRSYWSEMLCEVRFAAWGIAARAELARRARRDHDPEAERAAVTDADRLLAHAERIAAENRPWTGNVGVEGLAWLAMVRAEHTRVTGPGDPVAWRAAVDGFGYGNEYQQAIARWRLAEALLGVDDRAGATDALAEVLAVTDRLGARPLAGAAAELARRARLAVPGLAPARDQVDPFTPRERAVLSLVALGRTNREVGQELYISEKTVSVHLSRIMAKLGASRRAEAVATAYERGLLEPTAGL